MPKNLSTYLDPLREVLIFAAIILAFHFFFRAWANWWEYWPIKPYINILHDMLSQTLFEQSVWVNEHILNLDFSTEHRRMLFENGYIGINYSCSGLKPMLQYMVLMLAYPGPWKHKLWFIPAGLIIVHLTNIFRITGLSVVLINWPDYWDFSHDYIFRPFFYLVIFLMWVLWAEYFKKK